MVRNRTVALSILKQNQQREFVAQSVRSGHAREASKGAKSSRFGELWKSSAAAYKLTDNQGVVQGLDGGEYTARSDDNPDADEWKNIHRAIMQITREEGVEGEEEEEGLEKQVVVRHFQAHVTSESRKHMKDQNQILHRRQRESIGISKHGAVLDKSNRAEWPASEDQKERETVFKNMQYAVRFHASQGIFDAGTMFAHCVAQSLFHSPPQH